MDSEPSVRSHLPILICAEAQRKSEVLVWFILGVNVLNSAVDSLDSSICAWESQMLPFEKYLYSLSINTSERFPKSFGGLDVQWCLIESSSSSSLLLFLK